MKVDSLKIAKVFSSGGEIHYALPHFQRQYSWERVNWQTLLDDALAIYEECELDQEPEHFLGSLVVINDGTRNGVITAFNLVDGQQRLTTISLLLCALRDLIQDEDPQTARRIQRLLVNSEEGDIYFKLFPTKKYGDREAYISIINGEHPDQTESTIPKAYDYLKKALEREFKTGEISGEMLFKVISNCFQVVFIELSRDENPYKIFESLNAKGKPLTQADLVRNYIAMRLPTSKQEKIFVDHWGHIEEILQEKRSVGRSRLGEMTAFLRHYIAMRSRVLCSEEHVYARFRDRGEEYIKDGDFVNEIAILRKFAEYYNKLLRPEQETYHPIQEALLRLNTLEIQTAYPFLLLLYDKYDRGELLLDDFVFVLTTLENYFVRRYLCASDTSRLNKIFPVLWQMIEERQDELRSDQELIDESISFRETVKSTLVNNFYPSDTEVSRSLPVTKLYDRRGQTKTRFVLETINRYLSKGTGGYTVLDGKATIEHIMPQTLSQAWKEELGEGAQRIHQDHLHTLGNLTLVTQEWNSSLSNSDFSTKKQILAEHGLSLNSVYFSQQIPQWDRPEIARRTDFLCEKILKIWPELGEPTVTPQPQLGIPISLVIRNEKINIPNRTWRQLRVLTIEWILKHHSDKFPRIRQEVRIFSDSIEGANRPKDWYQLSNSVWAYVSGSAKQQMLYCRRLLESVGVPEPDWSVEQIPRSR